MVSGCLFCVYMAVLISKATGNLTSSSTWGLVDSTSYLNAENGSEVLTTAYSGTRSSTFTPGAITIDAIAVKLSVRTGTTGTMSVSLYNSTGAADVSGTEVTIDCADLPAAATSPADGGWIQFELSSPVLLSAATDYRVQAKTSSATQISLFRDGTTDNIARALRTTTEQAPTTGDDMIVAGEYTGQGTSNTLTVTMNETATTDYGSASTSAVLPALAVCSKGVLTYGASAATNYYLKLSGNAIVYNGGIFNIGTTGTPIPRDSTAVIEFDCAADGDFGLIAREGSTYRMQGLSRTSAKNITWCLLNTDEAANSTSLGVDTDTGWLDNDEIVVASTSRTATECERGALNGNAGASSLTVDGFAGSGGGLLNAHSGTTGTQAEVGLLTRNVRLRSASSTAMTFLAALTTSTVDIDWSEIYYVGEDSGTFKRGVSVTTTTGSFNMHYSSVHDSEDWGVYISGTTANNFHLGYNVFYGLNTGSTTNSSAISIVSATSGTTWTMDNNAVIFCAGVNTDSTAGAIRLGDLGGTFTNNRVAGSPNRNGINISGLEALGTFSGNVVHSNASQGIYFSNIPGGTITNTSIWRNSASGVFYTASSNQNLTLTWDTLSVKGNSNSNINLSAGSSTTIYYKSATIDGDSSFSTSTGFATSSSTSGRHVFMNSSFGSNVAHTSQDISFATSSSVVFELYNTTLASTTETSTQSSAFSNSSYLRSTKHDGSSTTHKSLYRFGTIASDQATRHTASGYSWKMTPNNASNKLILPGPSTFDSFKAAVNASSAVTITAYVQKDSSYNGNAPRLVLVGGFIGGITSDVTDSLSVGADTWEQLSVSGTPSEAGVVDYYIDCDGTAGNIYVDDISVSQ